MRRLSLLFVSVLLLESLLQALPARASGLEDAAAQFALLRDLLYAVHQRSSSGQKDLLFQVDPTSGARVADAFGLGRDYAVIDGPGLPGNIDEITVDPGSGQLYGVADGSTTKPSLLVQIDKTSGAATVIGSTGVRNIEGLSFAGDGRLYGSTGLHGDTNLTSALFTIDLSSGGASLVGRFDSQKDYEGLACQVTSPLVARPTIDAVTINGGVFSTDTPTITIDVAATAPASRTIESVLITEYTYSPTLNLWSAARSSGWLSYTTTPSSFLWSLEPSAGTRYFHVAGAISLLPTQVFINYTPLQGSVVQGQVQVYRYRLNAGDHLAVRLEASSGDPDLTMWSPEADQQPWRSNLHTTSDQLSIIAPSDGIYQVEIEGYTQADYRLSVSIISAATVGVAQDEGGLDPAKPQRQQPAVPLDSVPAIRTEPEGSSTAASGRRVYLTFVGR